MNTAWKNHSKVKELPYRMKSCNSGSTGGLLIRDQLTGSNTCTSHISIRWVCELPGLWMLAGQQPELLSWLLCNILNIQFFLGFLLISITGCWFVCQSFTLTFVCRHFHRWVFSANVHCRNGLTGHTHHTSTNQGWFLTHLPEGWAGFFPQWLFIWFHLSIVNPFAPLTHK